MSYEVQIWHDVEIERFARLVISERFFLLVLSKVGAPLLRFVSRDASLEWRHSKSTSNTRSLSNRFSYEPGWLISQGALIIS